MSFRRFTFIGIALILLVATVITGCQRQASADTVVVATDATWPPMEFVNEQREIVGYDIDLMRAVAEHGGFEIEFRNVAWDGIFAGLAAGEYDAVISSVTITDERRADYDFSTPYINAGQIVVVRTGSDITGPDTLSGRTVGAQIGTTGAFAIQDMGDVTLREYDEVGLAFEDLLAGRLDAVVCDTPVAADFALQREEYKEQLQIVGESFTEEYYGILVQKGNTELLEKINKGLEEVQRAGIDQQIADTWLR